MHGMPPAPPCRRLVATESDGCLRLGIQSDKPLLNSQLLGVQLRLFVGSGDGAQQVKLTESQGDPFGAWLGQGTACCSAHQRTELKVAAGGSGEKFALEELNLCR